MKQFLFLFLIVFTFQIKAIPCKESFKTTTVKLPPQDFNTTGLKKADDFRTSLVDLLNEGHVVRVVFEGEGLWNRDYLQRIFGDLVLEGLRTDNKYLTKEWLNKHLKLKTHPENFVDFKDLVMLSHDLMEMASETTPIEISLSILTIKRGDPDKFRERLINLLNLGFVVRVVFDKYMYSSLTTPYLKSVFGDLIREGKQTGNKHLTREHLDKYFNISIRGEGTKDEKTEGYVKLAYRYMNNEK